jgi:lipid A 3-O-deacylase
MRYTKFQSMWIALGMQVALSSAAISAAADLAPSSAFVQAGVGDQRTTAYTAGLTWDLPWHCDFRFGRLGAYAEAAIGRWHTDGGREATAWPTQISATPTLRLHPARTSHWFAEAGVGANYIVPIFNSGEKRFSTEFNFGDHVAIGHDFGHSEVSLRMEHFSNAGIEHPNPGENFGQLRYAYRF